MWPFLFFIPQPLFALKCPFGSKEIIKKGNVSQFSLDEFELKLCPENEKWNVCTLAFNSEK